MTPENIKKWRDRLGLSQPQMARYIGIPESTYIKWETGRREPPAIAERAFELLGMLEASGHPHAARRKQEAKEDNDG